MNTTLKHNIDNLSNIIARGNTYTRVRKQLLDIGFVPDNDNVYGQRFVYNGIAIRIFDNNTKILLEDPIKGTEMEEVKASSVPYYKQSIFEKTFNMTEDVLNEISDYVKYLYDTLYEENDNVLYIQGDVQYEKRIKRHNRVEHHG